MNSQMQEVQRKPYMTIGWVRQELRVLESEIAIEQGRRKGYQNERDNQRWRLRVYTTIFCVVAVVWFLVRALSAELVKVIFESGKAGDDVPLTWMLPSMIFDVVTIVLTPVMLSFFVVVLRKLYVYWKHSDRKAAKAFCRFFHMQNLSEQIFETELLLMRYHVDVERLTNIRAQLIEEEKAAKEAERGVPEKKIPL